MTNTLQEPSNRDPYRDGSPRPPIPEEVLGVPTQPLIDFTGALKDVALFVPVGSGSSVKSAIYSVDDYIKPGLRIFPLVKKFQSEESLSRDDIRPYTKTIRGMIPRATQANNINQSLLFGAGQPVIDQIDRRIEEEFPRRLPDLLDTAAEYVPHAEPYVEILEGFENPRQQFVLEISGLAQSIRKNARDHAKSQGRGEYKVTADDAAVAIRELIKHLHSNPEQAKLFPLLNSLLLDRLPEDLSALEDKRLGIIAPDLIAALESALPEEEQDKKFLNIVRQNPHTRSRIIKWWKSWNFYDERMKDITRDLLPSFRDLLPTSGKEVRATYDRINEFLKAK